MLLPILLACAAPSHQSLEVDGLQRSYTLHLPASLDPHTPVVFLFHGGGPHGKRKGRRMGRFTGLDRLAEQEGFVLVAPDSLDGHWNDGRAWDAQVGAQDDVAFFDALLEELRAGYGLEAERVGVTGISNGAFMSLRLACERAEVVSGAVAVVGAMSPQLAERCSPSQPVDVLLVLGTEDPLVPYEGGAVAQTRGLSLGAEDTAALWASLDGCAAVAEAELEELDPEDGTSVRVRSYARCEAGSEVRLLTIEGGGHTWPSGAQYLPEALVGRVSQELDGGELAWDFLSRR